MECEEPCNGINIRILPNENPRDNCWLLTPDGVCIKTLPRHHCLTLHASQELGTIVRLPTEIPGARVHLFLETRNLESSDPLLKQDHACRKRKEGEGRDWRKDLSKDLMPGSHLKLLPWRWDASRNDNDSTPHTLKLRIAHLTLTECNV